MKKYTRVVIFISDDDRFIVSGYRRSTFHPEGSFPTIGEALEHALALPVRDDTHPINIIRKAGEDAS